MIRNYLVVAYRHFKRNFNNTLINIIGLSLGLAGTFVMGSWVWQELSYEKHFQDYDKIARVSVSFYNSGAFASGPGILNNVLDDQAPEVDLTTRFLTQQQVKLHIDDRVFEENAYRVDTSFFQLFSYRFLHGNPLEVLSQPNSLVISEKMAIKLFGVKDVVGEIIELGDEKKSFQVSGVTKSEQKRSHLKAEIWLPLAHEGYQNWTSAQFYNYVKLEQGASLEDLKNRLETIRKENVYPALPADVPYQEWSTLGMYDFHIVPLIDIHLDPPMKFELSEGGNRNNVYIFLITALFLISIAVINFINLSTAQSATRANEVGIRKTLGSHRISLIIQHLTESVMVSLASLLIGLGLAELFLIAFKTFTEINLIEGLFNGFIPVLTFIIFALIIGVIAGLYPAFYLSRFKPVDILKSHMIKEKSGKLRNGLVIVQFTISISLIICTFFVVEQLQHLRNADIGFDRENVVVINNIASLGENKEEFRQKMMQHTMVFNSSLNKRMPAGPSIWIYSFQSHQMEQSVGFQTFIGDDQLLNTLGFKLLEGRNFSREIASDSSAIILTQSAAKELLIEEPYVGTQLKGEFHVIGIVSDFTYQSFTEKPSPAVILYESEGNRLALKLSGNDTANFLDFMIKEWNHFSPDEPVNYHFIDDKYEALMEKEKTLSRTIALFAFIAIIISCLGLFGLASYTAQQRKKEIGIRKVLGATISNIVFMLNKDFSKLIAVSILLAVPIGWYLMNGWLQNFEYQVPLNPIVFILAGTGALFIAWSAVSLLSFKTASENPIDSLKEN